MSHVGRGNEENLGKVVLHVQVVVHEHVVLFRVEHFKQRGRRIAPEVHAHLVDFVEQEDRVHGAGLLHHLDNLAGKGTDVGPAMAANFGFVPHTTKGHADELTPCGLGYGHSE